MQWSYTYGNIVGNDASSQILLNEHEYGTPQLTASVILGEAALFVNYTINPVEQTINIWLIDGFNDQRLEGNYTIYVRLNNFLK
jgi:hypothetical protein